MSKATLLSSVVNCNSSPVTSALPQFQPFTERSFEIIFKKYLKLILIYLLLQCLAKFGTEKVLNVFLVIFAETVKLFHIARFEPEFELPAAGDTSPVDISHVVGAECVRLGCLSLTRDFT